MKYSKRKLKNGLTIIEVPSNDAESVVVDFFVKTGSRSETPKENGISHFLEHFLFKGTEKYPSAMSITELVDGIGGEMNANTGKEHTQYYIKAHHSNLKLIFEVLTDMIQRPLLDEAELEKEKGVIVEELNMYRDIPMAELENLLEAEMWPKHPLGQPIVGKKETVTKFNRAMFRSYLDRHYQPGNMILGVSGKYDRKKLDALIKKYWSGIEPKRFHRWDKVTDNQKKPRLKVQFKETEQAHLVMAFKGLKTGHKLNPVAHVMGAVLGGGMSSRLFHEIREKRGLAYYVRSSFSAYQDIGMFHIGSGVQVDKITEAVDVIISELHRLREVPVDAKELKKAKEYIKGRTTLALEDNQNRLDWCIENEASLGKIVAPRELFAKIDRVSPKQVQALATEFFQSGKLSMAVVGPYKSDTAIAKLLKKL